MVKKKGRFSPAVSWVQAWGLGLQGFRFRSLGLRLNYGLGVLGFLSGYGLGWGSVCCDLVI